MKNFAIAAVAIASLTLTTIGCGGRSETVTTPPENAVPASELPSQQGYESAMQNQGNGRPGN
ncbi:hypothetical protein [Roseiconus lacunae]|uniref:hypothetical protein n=1 Tax=Roseiconus lacunae TaxID=2605694 RepID=UPI0011F2561F|nr:hypothetical protein [Roseiconus lacunae]MCD0460946.1 hypothetical protein [Roseiconus lacunae]